jgi:Zn-dependent protease with chaperone function
VDVGDDRDAHGRRATLARAALCVAAAGWAVAALFLLRTKTPDLDLPELDPAAFFPTGDLDRIEAYRSVTRWLWVGSIAAELAVLAVLAWKARPLASMFQARLRGRVRTGVALGLAAACAAWLATLPFAAFGHVWRRRYGLSEQGYAAWLGDEALSLAVTVVLVGLTVAGAIFLAKWLRRRWWLPGGAALAVLAAAFVLVQPLVIQPLFNDFRPLPDRALAAEIERLAGRLGVDVGEVDVADASRRTTAANAHVSGVGPTKRVVLDDTLLDGRFTRGEISWVAAHELGHVAREHVWKGAAWFVLFAVPGLALIAWIADRRGGLADPAQVPVALLCAFALFIATLPAQNAISRRYEAEADWLALTATQDAESAIGLEQRFALTNLSDPTPPGWARMMLGTHPTPLERIGMALAFDRT